jgi:hypothetical protein
MIDLTGLPIAAIEPSLVEFGGIQRGSLGGPSQNLQRLGNRWAFGLALPPLPAASPWPGLIAAAKQQGALIRLPEPGYTGGGLGTPIVRAATAGGTSVPLSGMTANAQIPAKWISFIVGGVRYVHLIVTPAATNGFGETTITITPMLRVPLPFGTIVEIGQPKAQGLLVDRLSWGLGSNRLQSFSLQLEERA